MEYTCVICGKPFRSYNPKPMFCSLACKNRGQQAAVPEGEIVRLYQSGKTQEEVAREVGTTQKVVFNILRRRGIKSRPAIKRNQKGAANSSWRGDLATYSAFHVRVEQARGKPLQCERCGTTTARRYEWANLTGNYADTQDYIRLCGSCHKRHDAARRKASGKPTSKHVPRRKRKE